MHLPSAHQLLGIWYIYLINFLVIAEPVFQHHRSRGIFGPQTAHYDATGKLAAKDIVKSQHDYLQVTNTMQNHLGEWHQVRSLGGPMALKWLHLHAANHPNTTVAWANGTVVHSHQVSALLPHVKRWGWGDAAIELTLWGTRAFTISNAGLAAGFTAAVVGALFYFGTKLLSSGKSSGSVIEKDNNKKMKRASREPNVYYVQSVTNQDDTGRWPSGDDMKNAIHSALQDMTDHDYQGACYDALINDRVYGPGEGCPVTDWGHLGFCSWRDGERCDTPSCQLGLGQQSQCNGDRAADGQYH